MKLRTQEFRALLEAKRAVKVIAGIANFDLDNVLAVVRAASQAGAAAVDVAAQPEILQAVRKSTDLTVFASSIQPKELAMAATHGADVVELGNYDALYAQGIFLTADDVMKLAEETVKLVSGQALISVTLPGHLSIETQIRMAKALETMGVDMLQTEGASRVLTAEPQLKALSAAEKAEITFSNTQALLAETRLPVMTASGIDAENITQAFGYGAAAVGVGSAVNKLGTEAEMLQVLSQMMTKVTAMAPAASALELVS